MLFISQVRHRVDTDSAWWHENANDLYVFWLHQFSKFLHNHVNTVFVEITVVAKREEIEFKRLALYHFLTRDVVNDDLREIRLPCLGAQTCELRTVEGNEMVILRVFVHKFFKYGRVVIIVILRFLITKKANTFQFLVVSCCFLP